MKYDLISSSLRDNVTNMIRPLLLVMFSSLALTIFSPLKMTSALQKSFVAQIMET